MTVSPFDHPMFRGLLGDPEIAGPLSFETELLLMLAFEIALAEAEAAAGLIPETAVEPIRAALSVFTPDADALAEGVARDGVVVPELVRQLRRQVGAPHDKHLHFGATSQDLIDSALMVRLKMAAAIVDARLEALDSRLEGLTQSYGNNPLMGRTRMQDALPIAAANRVGAWRAPLGRLRFDLPADLFVIQFGGPVGTLAELGENGPIVRAALAEALGLADAPCWHAQRDRVVRYAGWLATISGQLGKIGQDVALMAQAGEIVLEGGGGSSAMPHKQNPVNAEVLVALARYNATLVSAMHNALVHEQERSGAAWTLEWLALPQMVMTTAAGLRIALRLLGQVSGMGGSANG